MPNAQDTMFQEALAAIQAGNRARARDLLTRLLKTTQDNPEYWIWMSAVVETAKERAFCLNKALQLDPLNAAAKRGLAMMGAGPVDESQVLPGRYQRRNWQSKLFAEQEEERKGLPARQLALLGVAFVVVIGLILFAVLGQFQDRNRNRGVAGRRFTWTPSLTSTITVLVTPTGTIQPTPLALLLEATYTPTPIYVNTPHPANEAYRSAIRAYSRGDWETVRRFMNDLLTAEPRAADAHYYIGETYRAEGNYAEAFKSYNRALEIDPNFAPAYLGRARATLGRNPKDVRQAQIELETAIEKDGNYGEAYLELALLHIQNDAPEEAIGVLEGVTSLMPSSAQLYLYLGMAYLEEGDFQNALANARKARDLDLTMLPAYRLIGQILQAQGDLEGSLEPLLTYTQYEKEDAVAWVWLARAQQAAGLSDEAFQSLDRALRLDKNLYEALLRRGQMYLERQEGEKALEDFRAALSLQSDSFDAGIGIARALMLLDYPGDGYMQLERTSGLAKTDAQKAELYYWRGQSLEALGEFGPALRTWNALLALPKGSASSEWLEFAQQRVAELTRLTPTVTPTRTPTSTQTRVPTATTKPSATPRPTQTRKP